MLKTKFVSSQEKIFIDQSPDSFSALEKISALRGERLSVQFIYSYDSSFSSTFMFSVVHAPLKTEGSLAQYATLREVCQVPVTKTVLNGGIDDNYLRTEPGLFPDVLRPLHYGGGVNIAMGKLTSVWVEINIPKDLEAGEYDLTVSVDAGDFGSSQSTVKVEVINAVLPDEDIYFTQWFHSDCLANYYNVEVWSEEHWRIVENFVHTARRNGINLLLTPVFTPPLDTLVGGERRTTQLVGVTKNDSEYTFDFSLLDRWVDMCNRQGIKYFEISHLFTQWGATSAPKIMATVDGEYKQLFGWNTVATGEEYSSFLRKFLTELLKHMKARGDDKRCFFHISDEPSIDHLENYKAAKAIVADILRGYTIMDALSKLDFYKTGAVDNPIPSNNHIAPFIESGVKNLWTYYCCSQWKDVSNRYHSMPAWRNRSIGMQMFKFDIKGFLHWGYNFYNNQYSADPINPYIEQSADYAFPGGDCFSVYPANNGDTLESPRLLVFYEALQDIKAMKLCESYYGHGAVVSAIEDILGRELTFDVCAKSSKEMLAIREKINSMIKAAVSK